MTDNDQKYNILLLEDEDDLREYMIMELEEKGYNVTPCENGTVAMEKFKPDTFDVIISDVRMPEMDGVQFLKNLRSISPLNPPFVFTTAFLTISNIEAYDMGATELIGKPINMELLPGILERITSSLEGKWRKEVDKPKPFNITVELENIETDEKFELGNNGFFVQADNLDNLVLNKDENLAGVHITFKTGEIKELKGVGNIKWARQKGREGLMSGLGVEILHIEKPYRLKIKKLIQKRLSSKTIPMGQAKSKENAA